MRLYTTSLITLILAFFAQMTSANTDEREWTFKSGEKIRAAQLSYDTETSEVILLIENSKEKSIQFENLSPIDQAWLIEWSQIEKEMDALIEHLGGRFEHYDWDYPSGMRGAMINGNNDNAANNWLERDGKVLPEKGNKIGLFSFEGGHQPTPATSRSKALERMINEGGVYD